MDPMILKHYMLIHDNRDGSLEKAMSILTQMRTTFGSSECRLLCVNSAQDGGLTDRQENPWIPYENYVLSNQNLGRFLNNDDLNEMKDLMHDLSSKHIIPHMEQKIRVLNQQVSATRKGFRNQIKNLWWRKGKDDMPDVPTGPMYTFSSIESQIRVLGDYAFMLRDYELALSNYRLLSTDYKLDKSWKRYAGAQEMMGLTYFMLDQSKKDAEYCMESAFTTYLKLGSSGQQNVTRCGLWWTEMLKAREQYKEAAGVYFRISNEEPSLQAAVLLEQASYCYLMSSPPMFRKYGFHLVLAGNRYYISDQRKHAIRAHRSALSVYKENTWNYINDHVHFHIGKWYAFLGLFDVAIQHILKVLACSHQSIATQELFLRDFFQIVQKLGRTFEVFRLQLPVINMSSLKIIFEDHRTYASSAAVNVKESLWHSLEEDMVPSMPTMRINWLESDPKDTKKQKNSNVCVAGEAIKVNIEVRNPLKISILVSSFSLLCHLYPVAEVMESVCLAEVGDQYDNGGIGKFSMPGAQNDLELKKMKNSWELSSSSSSFVLSEVNFTLVACETTVYCLGYIENCACILICFVIYGYKVQLTVAPKVEGILKIVGVRWKLSGSVVGFFNFDSNLVKNKTRKRRKRTMQAAGNGLNFTVIKSLPKLEGCIHQLPIKAYAGELRRVVLELTNQSEFPVKNMKMMINHPRVLYPGTLKDMETEFPSCLEKQKQCEQHNVQTNTSQVSNGLLFSFPENVQIAGERTFLWPLWLRAGDPGITSLYISIYYEMESCSSDMRYRTLRINYGLEVLPALDMTVQISPCPSRLSEFLVRMEIVNRTSSECFRFHQLSSVGNQWETSSLRSNGTVCPSQLLVAGQAQSCFFKLKSCSKSTFDDITTFSELQVSDVRLESLGSNEGLFDVSCAPLADFHNAASKTPVWWIMDGPRVINYNFSTSCDIKLRMKIHNSSDEIAFVRINTFDPIPSSGSQEGWYNISPLNDIKVTSDVLGTLSTKSSSPLSSIDGVSPYIWVASSSTRVEIDPKSSTEVPLQICLFSPGTYNLSNYTVHWNLRGTNNNSGFIEDGRRQISGTGIRPGHPYYLTVLQSP
ncbi:hypothetical protein GIB67_016867 [Kingdonia uniflora]|uniref:Trafficking protein particle complex subunit 8 n=1 Tax=Kingdonia uniflora TaxID=39325 RepID=A0A7J7LQ71_9MAGN|nr:hypothetical protein GIB67_016867 [Kingdonia uniflora]